MEATCEEKPKITLILEWEEAAEIVRLVGATSINGRKMFFKNAKNFEHVCPSFGSDIFGALFSKLDNIINRKEDDE